jgi:hypothetical protein
MIYDIFRRQLISVVDSFVLELSRLLASLGHIRIDRLPWFMLVGRVHFSDSFAKNLATVGLLLLAKKQGHTLVVDCTN